MASTAKDADIELKGPSDGLFVVERLGGLFKDRSMAAAITQFSLNPDEYHRLPAIVDSIAHFHYYLKRHGDTPIPVTLEMHVLTGLSPNYVPSANIFAHKVAQIKYKKLRKYGFTICNSSPYTLFPYLFYFDPEHYTIDVRG
jgi:hypothetical protein